MTKRSTDTKTQILAAAEQVLREKGLIGATTKEIARVAGYSEGTLYNHFSSKEDLFLAVMRENLPNFISTLNAIREQNTQTSLKDGLEQVVLAAIVYFKNITPLTGAFFADPPLLASYRALLKQRGVGPHLLFKKVAAHLSEEQERGRIRGDVDPTAIASFLLGSCFHYAFVQQFTGDDLLSLSDEDYTATLVPTLITILTADPTPQL